jgi:hypothetical protein
MAVSVDALCTAATTASSVTTLNSTNLTVGASATAILVFFGCSATTISALTIKWGTQTLTQLAHITNTSCNLYLFGGISPTSGAQTLNATWTTAAFPCMYSMSFTGTDTTSVATAFKGAATNSGSSAAPTVTVSGGAVGDISIASIVGNATISSLTATSSTQLFFSSSQQFQYASRAPGASSVAWTGAMTSSTWAIAGVDVAAPAAATFLPIYGRSPIQIWDH